MIISLWQSNYDFYPEPCWISENILLCNIPKIHALKSGGYLPHQEYSIPIDTLSPGTREILRKCNWTFLDDSRSRQVLKERNLGGVMVYVYNAKEL